MGKQYTLEAEVTEDHIYHARWASWHRPDDARIDPIVTAIRDAGVDDVKVEFHVNLLPPNHNWGIWLNGKRYQMTYAMLHYYDDYRIHSGDRNEPAVIQFGIDGTVDVRILPPDNRPAWEKEGLTYMQWHERNIAKWNEQYGKPKPLLPIWQQKDSFPDWLKRRDMSNWTQSEIDAHFRGEGDKDG